MFTGLIEEMGLVLSLEQEATNLNLEIQAQTVIEDMKLGDSIAIDGVCQTVTKITQKSFWVTAIQETLKLTNFSSYKLGTKVNLERCLRLSDRLGGHLVQGHVDTVGIVQNITNQNGSFELKIELPASLMKYVIHKGSLTVNGISLTIAALNDNLVTLCIIPKTWELTNVSQLQKHSPVNIEVDQVAKYIENLVAKSVALS